MESISLEKGLLNAPQPYLPQHIVPGEGTAHADGHQQAPAEAVRETGTAALNGTAAELSQVPVEPPRYGYRQDSPPEVIALLHQAQAGNAEAFAELYRQHVDRITSYVRVRMRNESRDAIPDVVQDAFCEAFADLPRSHADVTGWLLTHAAKAYIRYVRSERKQERVTREAKDTVRREYAYGHSWEARPSETVTAIGHVMLVHALARLTPGERRTIQHRYIEGQSQSATAELVGKSVRAVKSSEYRALGRLRVEFSDLKSAGQDVELPQ